MFRYLYNALIIMRQYIGVVRQRAIQPRFNLSFKVVENWETTARLSEASPRINASLDMDAALRAVMDDIPKYGKHRTGYAGRGSASCAPSRF